MRIKWLKNPTVLSLFIIIFSEAIPLKFVNLPDPFDFNQLLYLIGFLISFSWARINRFIASKYFKWLFIPYLAYLLIYFIIENFIRREDTFIFPLFNAASVFILLYCFSQIKSFEEIQKLLSVLISFLLLDAIWGFLVFFIGEPFAEARMYLGGNLEGWVYLGKNDRIAGLSPTLFAYAYPVVITPLLAFSLFQYKNQIKYILFTIFGLFIMVMNGERASFGAVVLFALILSYKLKLRIGVLSLVISLALLFVAYSTFKPHILSDKSAYSRVISSENSDTKYRFLKMYYGLKTVISDPLTGGKVTYYENEFYKRTNSIPSSIHNTYINVARNAGIFGFIAFLIFVRHLYIIIMDINRALDPHHHYMFYGIIYSFYAILIVGFFHNAGVFTREPWTWILIGIIVGFHRLIPIKNITE